MIVQKKEKKTDEGQNRKLNILGSGKHVNHE